MEYLGQVQLRESIGESLRPGHVLAKEMHCRVWYSERRWPSTSLRAASRDDNSNLRKLLAVSFWDRKPREPACAEIRSEQIGDFAKLLKPLETQNRYFEP